MSSAETKVLDIDEFGTYHKRRIAVLISNSFYFDLFFFTSPFIFYTPDHKCNQHSNNVTSWTNYSETRNTSQNPLFRNPNVSNFHSDSAVHEETQQQCYQLHMNDTANITQMPCQYGWDYDVALGVVTVPMEFDVICDKAWLKPMMQSLQMIGAMIGPMIGGVMADRYGRKYTLIISNTMTALCYIGLSFAPSIIAIAIIMFMSGLVSLIFFQVPIVMLQELVPKKNAWGLGVLQVSASAIGYACLPLLAYFLPNWRHLVLAIGVVVFLGCLPNMFLSETLRWLVVKRKKKEIISLLKSVAETNGSTLPENIESLVEKILFSPVQNQSSTNTISNPPVDNMKAKTRTYSYLDLIRISFLRRRFFILSFAWFEINLCFFGFAFNADKLGVSRYISVLLVAFSEILGCFLCFFMVRWLGHRIAFIVQSAVGGLFLLAIPFLVNVHIWAGMIMAMAGKVFISGSYALLYVFTSKMFPTLLRNQSYGACNFVSKIGSILVPYILFLGEVVFLPLPYIIMCIAAVLGAIGIYFLPETNNLPLPDTLEDAKRQDRFRPSPLVLRKKKTGNVNNTIV